MNEILKGEKLQNELRGRDALSGNIKLRSKDKGGKDVIDDFEIEGVLHAGGSCIAYKAVHYFDSGFKEHGILKELYPLSFSDNLRFNYKLKRRDIDSGILAKQLYSEEDTLENFRSAVADFKKCYKKLSALKEKSEVYDSFFAPIHFYYGISESESENRTIYIWSPGDSSLRSFDDHLTEMHSTVKREINSPSGNLNLTLSKELHTVLQTIRALAIGINELHLDDFLHLDIKPGNFGVRNLGINDGNNISVCLFDVNTLYSGDARLTSSGSPHFRGPEMTGDRINNLKNIPIGIKSDIFSLGATFFNAVILMPNGRGLYNYEDFGSIDTLLSHSLLMEYSEYNSRADLHDLLSSVLKRSLARRRDDFEDGTESYISVAQFIADIEKADSIVLNEISNATKAGAEKRATVTVSDSEEYFDKKISGGALGSMQKLLYEYPVFNYAKNGSVKILVLGAGVFGQKFADIVFEMSQIKGCYPDLTVVSKNKEQDEKRYLNTRAEFSNFFEVNGKSPKYKEYGVYGSITFKGINSDLGDGFDISSDENIRILKDSLGSANKKFDYAFVSLADDVLNQKVASDLALSDLLTSDAAVNFVTYKNLEEKENSSYGAFGEAFDKAKTEAQKKSVLLNPVEIGKTVSSLKDFDFLYKIALNCHLLWYDGLNLKTAVREFQSPYNYTSSFSNALALKYKLFSIGIDLSEIVGQEDAYAREKKLHKISREFTEKIQNRECLSELTMYEHRRWVTNMISQSYTVFPEEEFSVLYDTNKDKTNRKHTCLLPSSSDWALNSGFWTDFSHWDKDDIKETDEFKALDPLDRMSIMLHGHFMSLAEKFTFEKIEADSNIIRRYLKVNPEAFHVFSCYLTAMRTILSKKARNTTALHNFDRLYESLSSLTEDKALPFANEIKVRLQNIHDEFAPVRLAYEYTDYKAKDETLVKNTVFALNYHTSIRLGITFSHEWFENVASSIVINPCAVTYFAEAKSKNDFSDIKESLTNIVRVMDSHDLQTKISLIIYTMAADNPFDIISYEETEKEILDISSRITDINIIEITNKKNLASRIRRTVETLQSSLSRLTAIEITKKSSLNNIIYFLDSLPVATFEFDSKKMTFTTEDNADSYTWFSSLSCFNTYMHADDMFAAQNRRSIRRDEAELHADYKDIWDNCLYGSSHKTNGWRALCKALKNKQRKENTLLCFSKEESKQDKTEVTTLFAPSFCKASVSKLFDFFSFDETQLIEKPFIKEHNSSMIKISFVSSKKIRDGFLKLFENPYILSDETKISPIFESGILRGIEIRSLTVNGFSFEDIKEITEDTEEFNCAVRAIAFLCEKGYILKWKNTPGSISFTFASDEIRDLLTDENRLLELYTYYEITNEGFFDEIIPGVSVSHKNTANDGYTPSQKFDIVLIKGLSSQIINVNLGTKLHQNAYQELKANGDKFGINKNLILVSPFAKDNKEISEDYGIKTITDTQNIAKHLADIMNGRKD